MNFRKKRGRKKNKKRDTMKDKLWVVIGVLSLCIYAGWRLFFTLPHPEIYGWFTAICGIFLFFAEITSMFEGTEHLLRIRRKKMPKLPVIPESWYPEIDVLIATHNEETELLYKTLNGCKHMDYPDKSKVHIYLCDDNNRPEVERLAREMGVGYFGLEGNKLAKAGNLNNAISKTSSPWIVTLDADMIPMHHFLMETVPYVFLPKMKQNKDGSWTQRNSRKMEEVYKIGFIQAPQSFYNPDLFQYNFYSESRIPNEQDYFFREINVGRNNANAPIYAGSNTLISRKALEEVGGIATGTITEDFETGINIQAKGYTCYAIDRGLAHGLAPTEIRSLITQRIRWGRGCISSLRKIRLLTNPDIGLSAKMSYFACKMYWWSFIRRLVYIMAPIIFVLFGIPSVIFDLKGLLMVWLPAYSIHSYTISRANGKIRNHSWSNIIDTILFPYMVFPILMESFHIKQKKFHVTKKVREASLHSDFELALPHMVLLFFDVLAFFVAVFDLWNRRHLGTVVIVYWLAVAGIHLLMAILFMTGRRNRRTNDRFNIRVPARLCFDGGECRGRTENLSETGILLLLEEGEKRPIRGEKVRVRIKKDRYHAAVEGICIRLSEKEGAVECAMRIEGLEGENKSQYYQILYDKKHDFAEEISSTVGMFEDLFLNIRKRMEAAG